MQYAKENVTILYSLFLLILIPTAFFINNYLINSNYEDAIDKITQRNAVLVENIINGLAGGGDLNSIEMQKFIDRAVNENSAIAEMSILRWDNQGGFNVIASSNPDLIGREEGGQVQNDLAWNEKAGIAFIQRTQQGRVWNVTKIISDGTNKKGLIQMSFSLEDSDALINKVINDSYAVLFLTILVVVLLISNQARLVGYAVAVTQIKEINKMKDMFISMASHELRSPLTAIKGYIDLLRGKKNINWDDEANRYVQNISSSVQRLGDLVEDILDVSRLEGNRLPIEMELINPNLIVGQCLEEMRSQAIQKNLAFTSKLYKGQIEINIDQNRLRQIVVNLISNAIKYTEKGSVEVMTAVKDKNFLITVADTGIGMSSEDQAKLFQKFYRIKNEHTKNIVGTGLGLWITLEIIKRMQGKINVESIEGVGTHFMVSFPAAA